MPLSSGPRKAIIIDRYPFAIFPEWSLPPAREEMQVPVTAALMDLVGSAATEAVVSALLNS